MHCQERAEERRRGRAVSFITNPTPYIHTYEFGLNVLSFFFSLSLDTCQTQSMLGQAISRGLQGVNAKESISPGRMHFEFKQWWNVSLLPSPLFLHQLSLNFITLHAVNLFFCGLKEPFKMIWLVSQVFVFYFFKRNIFPIKDRKLSVCLVQSQPPGSSF